MWYSYWYHVWYHVWYHGPASMISRTYDIIGIWYHSQYLVIFIWISCMISYMMSWSCIYDIKNLWYHRSMISEHTNMISYMIFSMCIPTSKNALGRALPKSLLAAWSSASSKSATVICRPPRQGPARPLRLTLPDPDRQCAISCQWVPVSPPTAPPPPSPPPVLVVILHLHLRWTRRRCSAGDPCAGAGRGGGAAGSSRPQRRSHPWILLVK
jgi:hypothetical protein